MDKANPGNNGVATQVGCSTVTAIGSGLTRPVVAVPDACELSRYVGAAIDGHFRTSSAAEGQHYNNTTRSDTTITVHLSHSLTGNQVAIATDNSGFDNNRWRYSNGMMPGEMLTAAYGAAATFAVLTEIRIRESSTCRYIYIYTDFLHCRLLAWRNRSNETKNRVATPAILLQIPHLHEYYIPQVILCANGARLR